MIVEKQTVSKSRSRGAPGKQGPADDGRRSEFMETWTVVLLRVASVFVLMIIIFLVSKNGRGCGGGVVPDCAGAEGGG